MTRGSFEAEISAAYVPHQALNMKFPAELYSPSTRPYNGLPELEYPFHDRTITVTRCDRICVNRSTAVISPYRKPGHL